MLPGDDGYAGSVGIVMTFEIFTLVQSIFNKDMTDAMYDAVETLAEGKEI
jgi:hypothetical protein